jgi:hypothetical protein
MIECAANLSLDLGGCVFRDEHLTICVGSDRIGRPCNGCAPRPAQVGHLCLWHSEQVDAAIDKAPAFMTDLWHGLKGARSIDGVRVRQEGTVNLEAYRLEADELWGLLTVLVLTFADDWGLDEPDFPQWTIVRWHKSSRHKAGAFLTESTPRMIGEATQDMTAYLTSMKGRTAYSKADSAVEALRFTNRLRTAMHRYPTKEHPKPVRYIECGICHNRSLLQWPPLSAGSEPVMKWSTGGCSGEYDIAAEAFGHRLAIQAIEETQPELVAQAKAQIGWKK